MNVKLAELSQELHGILELKQRHKELASTEGAFVSFYSNS